MRTIYNKAGPFLLAGLLLLATGWILPAVGGEGKPPAAGAEEKLQFSGPGAEHFTRAVELEDQQQYDAAIREYEAYLKAKPSIPYAYYYLGNLYHDLGQAEKGNEQFRKAAQASPG
jgi:tetratricopeptide (TPR) repeat protein